MPLFKASQYLKKNQKHNNEINHKLVTMTRRRLTKGSSNNRWSETKPMNTKEPNRNQPNYWRCQIVQGTTTSSDAILQDAPRIPAKNNTQISHSMLTRMVGVPRRRGCQEAGGAKKAGVPRRRGCQEGGGARGARPFPSRSYACQKTNRTNGSRDAVIQAQTSDPPCTHLLPTPPPYTTHTPQLPTNQPSSPPSQTPINRQIHKITQPPCHSLSVWPSRMIDVPLILAAT